LTAGLLAALAADMALSPVRGSRLDQYCQQNNPVLCAKISGAAPRISSFCLAPAGGLTEARLGSIR
jgi:hypothetical protein